MTDARRGTTQFVLKCGWELALSLFRRSRGSATQAAFLLYDCARAWQSSSESHLMNVTQASLKLVEGCEWKRNITLDRDVFTKTLPSWKKQKKQNRYTLFFNIFSEKKFLGREFKNKKKQREKNLLDNKRLPRCITLQAINRHNPIHVMYNMQDFKRKNSYLVC